MRASLFDESGGIVTGTQDTEAARSALRKEQAAAMGFDLPEAAGDQEFEAGAQWLNAEPMKGWGRWTRQPGELESVYWEELAVSSRRAGLVQAVWWPTAVSPGRR